MSIIRRCSARFLKTVLGLVGFGLLASSSQAWAIPAFARKYGTSCQTCHTVYPKLTPFGEAFRRNGYRFPGVDSDYVKQEPVALGQEEYKKTFPNSVWPGALPSGAPLAFGFNGQALLHPDKNATGAAADNNTIFTLKDLFAEAHLWTGGSFDDKTTFWGEVTFASDGSLSVEHAEVIFNDLVGPAHAVNLRVGHITGNVTSFGIHSAYVNDTFAPVVPVTALYGATSDSFNLADSYNGVELNGVIEGRLSYSVGINAGPNALTRPTENVYGHVAGKLGGMRLDGEGSSGPTDPTKPWAETALTIDAFAYHVNSASVSAAGTPFQDTSLTFGADLRFQWQSLELNSGFFIENHNHAQADNPDVLDPTGTTVLFPGAPLDSNGNVLLNKNGASLFAQYNELSYVVFPWMVPAVRVEYLQLAVPGGSNVSDVRIIPGIAFAIRPNIKLMISGQIEIAQGAPTAAGWGAANGLAAPPDYKTQVTEIESITAYFAAAF